jgi:hypothetical protein
MGEKLFQKEFFRHESFVFHYRLVPEGLIVVGGTESLSTFVLFFLGFSGKSTVFNNEVLLVS